MKRAGQKAAELKRAAEAQKAAEEKAITGINPAIDTSGDSKSVNIVDPEQLKVTTANNMNILAKANAFDNVLNNEKILESLDKTTLENITKAAHSYPLKNMNYTSEKGGDALHEIDNYLNYKSPYYGSSSEMDNNQLEKGLANYGINNSNSSTSGKDIIMTLKDWTPIADKKLDLSNPDDAKIVEDAIKNGGVKIDEYTTKKAAAFDNVMIDIKVLEGLTAQQKSWIDTASHDYAVEHHAESDNIHEVNNYIKAYIDGGSIAAGSGYSYETGGFFSVEKFISHNDIIQPLVEAGWVTDIDVV